MGAREDARRRRVHTVDVRTRIGADFRRLREDAGLSGARVADAAGISRSHYAAVERGINEASTDIHVAIADVLGADLSIRAYPNSGPRIHDRIQAPIVEEIISSASPRWSTFVEVPVVRPARGYVDLVLVDRAAPLLVACEVETDIRRLEQQLRWAEDKARSLPSSDLWARYRDAEVSRMLVLRSTVRVRALAQRFAETLATAYPASCRAVHAALIGNAPWPGPGILWVRVEGGQVALLDHPPRRSPGCRTCRHAR